MDCIHIKDSFKFRKRDMIPELERIKEQGTQEEKRVLGERTLGSLKREWCSHNLCYSMGLFIDRTRDVDLQYPLPWYEKIVYNTIGYLALILVK